MSLKKESSENRNSLINDTKLQNLHFEPNRPSGFTYKESKKKFQINRRINNITLVNDPLVTFLISVCPKLHILPNNVKKDKNWKVDARKPIYIVVYYTRNAYFFSANHRKDYWSHTLQWHFTNIFWHILNIIKWMTT